MSVAVILAARPVQIEGFLGGLDKFHHKLFDMR
jgi:predicted ferric reductase